MKKILIIDANPHYQIGGVETYVNYLIKILKGNDITEISLFFKKDKVVRKKENINIIKVSNKTNIYPFKAKKIINSIKYEEYSLIINNTKIATKKMLKQNNVIFVQHDDPLNYKISLSDKIKLKLDRIFLGLFGPINIMKKSKKMVYFSKENNIYNKNIDEKYFIPLPYNNVIANRKEYSFKYKNVYIGRINEKQKNMSGLNKISKGTNYKINVFGDGDDKNKLWSDKIVLHGSTAHDKILKVLKQSKVLLLPSNFEGFAFVIVEALSNGLPVVVFDSFISTKFYKKCKAVSIIEKGNYDLFIKKVNEISALPLEKYKKMSNEATEFALKYFQKKDFGRKWKEILNEVVEKDLK